jgi:VWFA-related protein
LLARALRSRFVVVFLAGVSFIASAQSPDPPPPNQGTYTLHVNTRVVLTDVTVTDSHGNPVRGLTQSDFRIYDDGHAQKLGSFEEHIEAPTPVPVAVAKDPSVFSNDSLLHLPSTVNVILIDTTTIQLIDQMYLYEELNKFVQKLPPGEPVAVFNRAGQATLLLQDFTSDHQLLLAAVREAVPHFVRPDAYYTTGTDTLQQIADYLEQIPGRKNVLWFSGGSNAYLYANPVGELPRRQIYDMLEAERIAIYPIDARGLTSNFGRGRAFQQMLMEQDAESTGGHAYFNNNGLDKIAAHLVDNDGTYYTVSYYPDDVSHDGRWHNVKVELNDAHYQLSYRRGYYDDGHNDLPPADKYRTVLRAHGSTAQEPTARHASPIIFRARILPASAAPTLPPGEFPIKPKRGETTYTVHYDIPATDIQPKDVTNNSAFDVVGVGIIAFNQYGTPVAHDYRQVTMEINEARLHDNPNANLGFDQQINLPKGEDYLYVLVWDMTSGRRGTLNLPLDVKKQVSLNQ